MMKASCIVGGALLCAFATAASAQSLVGACSPSAQDLGSISASETRSFVSCASLSPPSGVNNRVDYATTFDFQLTQPTSFYVYVQGSSYLPNQQLPYWSGIGIIASLFYGDQFVLADAGRGIGSSEGPALLNPDFLPGFSDANLFEPSGSYQIRVKGTGFGPIPQGTISATVYASFKPTDPVTPVPEPVTVALQLTGLALLAGLLARRNPRRTAIAAAA